MISARRRRERRPSGKERAVALLLRALADHIEAGRATANLRVEPNKAGREVWLCAASVAP